MTKATKEGSPDFVPVSERIATFDNDGTLWCEQPMYVQLAALRPTSVKVLAPETFGMEGQSNRSKLCWRGDLKSLVASGKEAVASRSSWRRTLR